MNMACGLGLVWLPVSENISISQRDALDMNIYRVEGRNAYEPKCMMFDE